MKEHFWSTIPEAPKYAVSSNGEVYSTINQRLIKKFDNGTGYLFVVMKHDGKRLTRYVHRLVAFAFCGGHTEERCCVNHKDGNKYNNSAENLEFCTAQENIDHYKRIGIKNKGNTKVDEKEGRLIFLNPEKLSVKQLAQQHGLSEHRIRRIKRGLYHRDEAWS